MCLSLGLFFFSKGTTASLCLGTFAVKDGDIQGHVGEGTWTVNSDLRFSEYPPWARGAAGVYGVNEVSVIKKSI